MSEFGRNEAYAYLSSSCIKNTDFSHCRRRLRCTSHLQSRTQYKAVDPLIQSTKSWNKNQVKVLLCPGRKHSWEMKAQARETSAPFGVALGTCCQGGWRWPWARSGVLSWVAGSERTNGRQSAPRRPSPPLPSSAAHVPAPAREQRRRPAWTSARGLGHQRGDVARPAPRGLLWRLSGAPWEAAPPSGQPY